MKYLIVQDTTFCLLSTKFKSDIISYQDQDINVHKIYPYSVDVNGVFSMDNVVHPIEVLEGL